VVFEPLSHIWLDSDSAAMVYPYEPCVFCRNILAQGKNNTLLAAPFVAQARCL
jgi:hypothetical protein